MDATVHVKDLGSPALTRPRGREAGMRLRGERPAGDLVVSLDGLEMLSMSFLDGLVLDLAEAGELRRVTFQTQDSRMRGKLQRVADLHPSLTIFVTDANLAGRQVVRPTPIAVRQPVVVKKSHGDDDEP